MPDRLIAGEDLRPGEMVTVRSDGLAYRANLDREVPWTTAARDIAKGELFTIQSSGAFRVARPNLLKRLWDRLRGKRHAAVSDGR